MSAPRSAAALALAALLAAAPGAAAEPGVPRPEIVEGRGEACVEPVELMRREHAWLLLAQRDRTVHAGDRSGKHGLAGCVECHSAEAPGGAFVPVDAPGQFCAACHAYASVRIDCFECHATVPAGARAAASGAGPGSLLDRVARAIFGGGAPR